MRSRNDYHVLNSLPNSQILVALLFLSCVKVLMMSSCEAQKFENVSNPDPISYNEIDGCWRGNQNWESTRKQLAACGKGYGADAQGGRDGPIYMVTDKTDDPINPTKGTLRYGAIQEGPLWIIFDPEIFLIELKSELFLSSYKTLDGRGGRIKIGNGPCVRIQDASHVIIHGVLFERCGIADQGLVRVAPDLVVNAGPAPGYGICLVRATHVWIDHCVFDTCTDHFIQLSLLSTSVTISNNIFTSSDKALMFGHSDTYSRDKDMYVTVMYNVFHNQLVQTMPWVRFGYAHIANNIYDRWLVYAIGGSGNSTILSECNQYTADDNVNAKEITRRNRSNKKSEWRTWSWTTKNDLFFNGAFFLASGFGQPWYPSYSGSQGFGVHSADQVPDLVRFAGPVSCVPNWPC